MVIFNRCEYETTKDSVSHLIALINKCHPSGNIYPTVKNNKVHFNIISNAMDDFYNMIPQFNFCRSLFKLNYNLELIRNNIENLFFERLQYGGKEIYLSCSYDKIPFESLLQIAMTLKFAVKFFPIHSDEMIYIGIGSKKLGYYIMNLFTDKACDGEYPQFDIDDGFIDPFKSDQATESNISEKTRYTVLNYYFKKWKEGGCTTHLLHLEEINNISKSDL